MKRIFSVKINYLILVFAIILLLFSSYKASNTSFTYDESFTYNNYVHLNLADTILSGDSLANNHLLNTLSMKLSNYLFGSSEISLRLPNILAHAAYILFSILILKKVNSGIVLPLFIITNFNPYLLDFFSIARGYGLAMGFMMGSIYFFIEFLENSQKKYYFISIVLSCFAVLSNFALIYFFFALLIIYNFLPSVKHYLRGIPYIFNSQEWLIANKVNMIAAGFLGIIIFKKYNSSFSKFGGKNGFWQDTVNSLIHSSLYGNYGLRAKEIIALLVIIITLVTLGFFLYPIFKKNKKIIHENKSFFLIYALILIISLTIILIHHIAGIKYNIQRTALFYIPLFALNVCFLLEAFLQRIKRRWLVYGCVYVMAGLFLFHATTAFNFNYYFDWKYDMNTKKALRLLENDANSNPTVLGVNWLFEPTANFYRKSMNLAWLKEINTNPTKKTNDYFFITGKDLSSVDYPKSKLMKLYQSNDSYLFKSIKNTAAK